MTQDKQNQIARLVGLAIAALAVAKQVGLLPVKKDHCGMERHVQSAIAVLILGVLAWVGSTTQQLTTAVASLEVRQTTFERQLEGIQVSTHDRFTASDAEQLRDVLVGRLEAEEERSVAYRLRVQSELDRMDERLDALEKGK